MDEKLVLWSGKVVGASDAQRLIDVGTGLWRWLIVNVDEAQRDDLFHALTESWIDLLIKIDPVEDQFRQEERWGRQDG